MKTITAANIAALVDSISKGKSPEWIQLHTDALGEMLSSEREKERNWIARKLEQALELKPNPNSEWQNGYHKALSDIRDLLAQDISSKKE